MKLKTYSVRITLPKHEGSITVTVKAASQKAARIQAELTYFHQMVLTAEEKAHG